jgi:uncharacterized protein YbjT (DUF2867 family)
MQVYHMIKSILVVGANGTTGRRLVPRLQRRGMMVRAASRTPGDRQIRFDWLDPESHQAALADVDAVYVIPPSFVENPVSAAEPFVAAAVRAGVRRLVLLSSMGAGFPGEPAGSGRRALETLVRTSGLEWTILRPSGFMQNFSEGFLLPAVCHGTIPNPAGSGKLAMIDAEDIAAVAAEVLVTEGASHGGQTYDVTGPHLVDFPEVAAMISRHAKHSVAAVPMSSPDFLGMLEGVGVPSDYAAMLVRDQEAVRNGAAASVADTVARVLGRDPIDFSTFASAASSAWR